MKTGTFQKAQFTDCTVPSGFLKVSKEFGQGRVPKKTKTLLQ
jgi:hypothetical protein